MLKSVSNERNNSWVVIKEAAAENGDTVVIDFVGSIDGVGDGGKRWKLLTRTWFKVNSSLVWEDQW